MRGDQAVPLPPTVVAPSAERDVQVVRLYTEAQLAQARAEGAAAERERCERIRALLTSGPIGSRSGERYIRADLIRAVLDMPAADLLDGDTRE